MTESEAFYIIGNIPIPLDDENYDICQYQEAKAIALEALEKIQQYKALGTVEELRIAKEKRIPKKPIMKPYFDDIEDEYLCCPTCGEILTDRTPQDYKDFYFHCLNCGQKIELGE